MKAVRFHEHGGPDVLRYEDAPDPDLASGDVLVRVRACALNHIDLWARRGSNSRLDIPLPHISGSDVAGEVADSRVPGVPAGRRVMLQPGMSCGRCAACLSGRDNECPQYEVLGHRHIPVVLLGAGVILLSAVLYLTMLVRSGRLPWRPRSRGIT